MMGTVLPETVSNTLETTVKPFSSPTSSKIQVQQCTSGSCFWAVPAELTSELGRLMGWGAEAPWDCFNCLSILSRQEQTTSWKLHTSSVSTCSVPCSGRSWGIWRPSAEQIISGRQLSSSSTSSMSSKSASSYIVSWCSYPEMNLWFTNKPLLYHPHPLQWLPKDFPT